MWTIGDVRVTEIAELTTTSAAHWLLPDATAERVREIEWLVPHYATADGKVHMTIRALVIESEGRRILVDTCLGNDKQRPVEAWNHAVGSVPRRPHRRRLPARHDRHRAVHPPPRRPRRLEHPPRRRRVGADVPERPLSVRRQIEWEHWQRDDSGMDAELRADSIQPVIDAGLVDLVATDARLTAVSRSCRPPATPPDT
jgi:hypothetical protein